MTKHISLFKMLDKSYDLVYIDYRDFLANDKETMQKVEKAIQTQEWEHLDECIDDDWMWQCQSDSIFEIIKNLQDELYDRDLPESFDVEEYIEKHREDIQYEIENRDESTPLNDLLRHTPDIIMFYDLDVEVTQVYCEQDYKDNYRAIKKALKLTKQAYKKEIDSLLNNASYGGMLRIFFSTSIEDMMNLTGQKKITFKNPEVCIHNSWNGSGMNETFQGLEITLPLNMENLRVEKAIGGYTYTYTDDICGMIKSWADSTQVNFK